MLLSPFSSLSHLPVMTPHAWNQHLLALPGSFPSHFVSHDCVSLLDSPQVAPYVLQYPSGTPPELVPVLALLEHAATRAPATAVRVKAQSQERRIFDIAIAPAG